MPRSPAKGSFVSFTRSSRSNVCPPPRRAAFPQGSIGGGLLASSIAESAGDRDRHGYATIVRESVRFVGRYHSLEDMGACRERRSLRSRPRCSSQAAFLPSKRQARTAFTRN